MKKMIYPILTGMLLFSSPALAEPIGMPTRSTPDITSNTQRANALFDQAFDALIERRPMELTRLGSRKFYDRWDDLSAQELEARYQLNQAWASRLEKELGDLVLEPEAELSLKLFLYDAERRAASRDFAEYDYPVNQMFGMHAEIPAFLINNHQVNNRWEAEAYVTRLERLPALMDQLTEGLILQSQSTPQ